MVSTSNYVYVMKGETPGNFIYEVDIGELTQMERSNSKLRAVGLTMNRRRTGFRS